VLLFPLPGGALPLPLPLEEVHSLPRLTTSLLRLTTLAVCASLTILLLIFFLSFLLSFFLRDLFGNFLGILSKAGRPSKIGGISGKVPVCLENWNLPKDLTSLLEKDREISIFNSNYEFFFSFQNFKISSSFLATSHRHLLFVETFRLWKNVSFFVAIPAIGLCAANSYKLHQAETAHAAAAHHDGEHHAEPLLIGTYMRIRVRVGFLSFLSASDARVSSFLFHLF